MMTGSWVARDIRMRIMPSVEAYNEDLFRDVLPALRTVSILSARAPDR